MRTILHNFTFFEVCPRCGRTARCEFTDGEIRRCPFRRTHHPLEPIGPLGEPHGTRS